MTDTIREQISALLDDELSGREASSTMDSLRQQEELRKTWDRYRLIGDAIRGEAVGRTNPSIADQVRKQLESEPAILAPHRPRSATQWARPLAGAALAASVAAVTIMGAPYLFDAPTNEAPAVAGSALPVEFTTVAQHQMPEVTRVVAISTPPSRQVVAADYRSGQSYAEYTGTRWKNLQKPIVESRLNKYLVKHSEYASQAGVRGSVPHAVFVGYDGER